MIVAIIDRAMTQFGGVIILITGFALLFLASEILRVRGGFAPESTRKLVHVLSGVSILALPYLPISKLTFVVLGISFTVGLFATHQFGLLPSIHAVPRKSVGAIVFPLAMVFLLLLPEPRGVVFTLSVLLLAIPDAVSGIIGVRYGKRLYYIADYRRSAEGSIAFFVTALPLSWGLLHLQGGYALLPALAGALILSVVVTVVEAISVWGWDNLTIPVASAGILTMMQNQNFPQSHDSHAIIVVGMILAILALYRILVMSVARAMGTFIIGYGAYALFVIYS